MALAGRRAGMLQMLPRTAVICLFAATALAACTSTQQRTWDSALGTAATPPDRRTGGNETQAAIAPKLPIPPPSQLLGMTPVNVTNLLGQPELVRFEPPAQVWLYRNESCVFHVYLYTTSGSAGYSVNHIAAVSLRGQTVPIDSCFAETVTGASHRAQNS